MGILKMPHVLYRILKRNSERHLKLPIGKCKILEMEA